MAIVEAWGQRSPLDLMLTNHRRVMVIGAVADSSILDVETGWVSALEAAGFEVYLYSLRNRVKHETERLSVLKNGMSCPDCGGQLAEPVPAFAGAGMATVMQAASECALHEAVRHSAQWVVVISGCSFHPNAAAMIQKIGIPVVVIDTESPYNDAQMVDLARVATVFAVNDRASLRNFDDLTSEVDGTAVYLPTGFHRDTHKPGEPDLTVARPTDVFFCGTGFDERARLLAEADWTGVDLGLAGFWPDSPDTVVTPTPEESRLGQVPIGHDPRLSAFKVAGLLPNRDLVEWYRATKVVLSIHRDHPDARAIGPRVYEAAACGAFQICDDSRPELLELFGDSVPTFRAGDPADMMRVIRYHLERPELRNKLAAEALAKVRGHSYDDRLVRLVEHITGP